MLTGKSKKVISEDDDDDDDELDISDDDDIELNKDSVYDVDKNDTIDENFKNDTIDENFKNESDDDIEDEYDEDQDDLNDTDIFVNDLEPDKLINNNLRVDDNDRICKPYLTKYEQVRMLGTRTKQIADGSKIFVKINTKDPLEIAKAELKNKTIPLKIKRDLPNGNYEIWSIKELQIL